MIKLTDRQKKILSFTSREIEVAISDILDFLNKDTLTVSRFSIVRDLNVLLQNDFINKIGGGRGTRYSEKSKHSLHKYVDIDDYFNTSQDERILDSESFEFDIFKKIKDILTPENIQKIDNLNKLYIKNKKKISKTIQKLETERFTIELAWKSSQIEGNTYSLLDTEDLIKNKVEATGHKKEEAVMILNHKETLDFIHANISYFEKISIKKLQEIHRLIVNDLDINYNIRKSPVGITGTNYKPLDNEYQIKEVVETMIDTINKEPHPATKALSALALISYIQPFEDGNKRTARILANAILIAHNYCPLSYRTVKESEYKKAVLIFYESHNIEPLKRLFIEQFDFAVHNYFRS